MSDPAANAFAAFLAELGVDASTDPELAETPRRYASLLRDWFVQPPRPYVTPIPLPAGGGDPVIIKDLPFHSLCVHHVVPFFGHVHVAYIPAAHIVGFGAVGRLLDWCSRKPQLQERLVVDLADALEDVLKPRALLVTCKARQMCMEMTGAAPHGNTIAVAARGEWADRGWEICRDLMAL
jgi:GTP cyclohydrolase IA